MLIDDVEARARLAFRTPPKRALSDWIEANIRLPSEVSALQGPLELWPFQRATACCTESGLAIGNASLLS